MAHHRVAALDEGAQQRLPREAFWVLPACCARRRKCPWDAPCCEPFEGPIGTMTTRQYTKKPLFAVTAPEKLARSCIQFNALLGTKGVELPRFLTGLCMSKPKALANRLQIGY